MLRKAGKNTKIIFAISIPVLFLISCSKTTTCDCIANHCDTSFGWESGYPALSSGGLQPTSAAINLSVVEDATVYYVVLTSNKTAPNRNQIAAGTDGNDRAAPFSGKVYVYEGTMLSLYLGGLTEKTDYKAYLMATSTNGRATEVNSVAFATPENTYPIDENTIAFWTFSSDTAENGDPITTVEDTKVFSDLTGNGNDLYLTSYINVRHSKEELPPLTYSTDTAYAHEKNKTSVLFTGNRSYGGYCFRVADDGLLNTTTFEDSGYTFEAIVKISSTFTAEANRWMGIMSLTYPRNETDTAFYYTNSDAPFGWTISDLLEVQFYSNIYNPYTKTFSPAEANWSSTMPIDTWHHIVITETPSTNCDNRILYVDGVASLRLSGKNSEGICAVSDLYKMHYLVGGNTFVSKSNNVRGRIFNGYIDAIRVSKGVIPQDKWLPANLEHVP
jgi:hypothetical protein